MSASPGVRREPPREVRHLVHAAYHALGDRADLGGDRGLCLVGDLDRGVEQRAVDEESALVDLGVEHPQRLLARDQMADSLVERALDGHVLLVVLV
jgi:hypothetical protein